MRLVAGLTLAPLAACSGGGDGATAACDELLSTAADVRDLDIEIASGDPADEGDDPVLEVCTEAFRFDVGEPVGWVLVACNHTDDPMREIFPSLPAAHVSVFGGDPWVRAPDGFGAPAAIGELTLQPGECAVERNATVFFPHGRDDGPPLRAGEYVLEAEWKRRDGRRVTTQPFRIDN